LQDAHVGKLARYALGRILKSAALPPRKEVPTPMEIEAIAQMKPVLTRVYQLSTFSHSTFSSYAS
jgi:hypothetical protein